MLNATSYSTMIGSDSTPTCSCHSCLFTMFLAIVGTLLALLIPPLIVSCGVYRTANQKFLQVLKPLLVVWFIFIAISISLIVVTIAFPFLTDLTVSDAIGISGGISGFLTILLMIWWRQYKWWTFTKASNVDDRLSENRIKEEYQAVNIDEASSDTNLPLNSFVQPADDRHI